MVEMMPENILECHLTLFLIIFSMQPTIYTLRSVIALSGEQNHNYA